MELLNLFMGHKRSTSLFTPVLLRPNSARGCPQGSADTWRATWKSRVSRMEGDTFRRSCLLRAQREERDAHWREKDEPEASSCRTSAPILWFSCRRWLK